MSRNLKLPAGVEVRLPEHQDNARVRQLLGVAANARGKLSEAQVLASIERLQLSWIKSVRLSDHHEDRKYKIDIVCGSDIGNLYLQVKSSQAACDLLRKQYPGVRWIECVVADSDNEIMDRRVYDALHNLRERFLQRSAPKRVRGCDPHPTQFKTKTRRMK